MRTLTRRDALRSSGCALLAAMAGCLADGEPGDGSGNGDGSGDGDGNNTGDGDGDGNGTGDGDENGVDTELRNVETIQFAAPNGEPHWYDPDVEPAGHVVVIDSAERTAPIWPHDDVAADRREEVADFLEDGSFEDSVLLYVASVGPNTCHDALEVTDVALEDGTLVATATVVDTSGERDACGSAVTFPSALVRATFSGEPVTDAEITIVDGWGNEATVSATAADPIVHPLPLEGYVRPAGDPPTVPDALECDADDVERVASVDEDEIELGAVTNEDGEPTFGLRVDRRKFSLGETVTVSMTNVTDEDRVTGNRHKHALEIYTEDGWTDVRVAPDGDGLAYTDEGVSHAPGEGFEWSFELTEAGVLAGHTHEDALEVCPDLQPGRYRFVFLDPVVAVEFDVTER